MPGSLRGREDYEIGLPSDPSNTPVPANTFFSISICFSSSVIAAMRS
jgi:hypothetical protein